MRLSPIKFNRLLRPPGGLGQAVTWRRADACPCRDPHSGAARPGCPQCSGKGVIWSAPAAAWTGLSSMRIAREWAAFGMWESGDVVLTIPADSPLYAAGEYDRIVMTDSSEPFSRVLRRDRDDTISGGPIVQVDRVFWIDQAQAIVEGSPAVAGDGTVTWPDPPAASPPPGTGYTVTGRMRQEYYIFRDLPQDRAHHGGAALPRRVVARRFDLFGR